MVFSGLVVSVWVLIVGVCGFPEDSFLLGGGFFVGCSVVGHFGMAAFVLSVWWFWFPREFSLCGVWCKSWAFGAVFFRVGRLLTWCW